MIWRDMGMCLGHPWASLGALAVAIGEEGIQWRFGGKPDYALANLKYLQGPAVAVGSWFSDPNPI